VNKGGQPVIESAAPSNELRTDQTNTLRTTHDRLDLTNIRAGPTTPLRPDGPPMAIRVHARRDPVEVVRATPGGPKFDARWQT